MQRLWSALGQEGKEEEQHEQPIRPGSGWEAGDMTI